MHLLLCAVGRTCCFRLDNLLAGLVTRLTTSTSRTRSGSWIGVRSGCVNEVCRARAEFWELSVVRLCEQVSHLLLFLVCWVV